MGYLQLKHLNAIAQGGASPAMVAETWKSVLDAINTIAKHTAISVVGPQVQPPPPVSLNVIAANGIFDVAIQDNNPAEGNLAPEYFVEYSTSPSFNAPIVKHLGPSRNWRPMLGNQTLYFRAYSQFGRSSAVSAHRYFGPNNAPTPVIGGGVAGPTIQASAGSGTNPTSGLGGGVGYGRIPVRKQA